MRTCSKGKLGLTVIELLVIIGLLILTILGSRLAGLLGGLIGFLMIPVIASIWFLLVAIVKEGIPRIPRCRNGCCRGYRDYKMKRFGEEFNWVCKCGDRYTRCGRRFMQITDKEEKIPCKIWHSFRGWYPDEDQKESK
jgi:hypothetical protein